VAISLGLMAVLIMKFSKGQPLFTKSYNVFMKTSDIGGLRVGSGVFMAGVRVGTLDDMDLDPDGKLVTMRASILERYHIKTNATFTIQQAGFLGDQFIYIVAGSTNAPNLKPGDSVYCVPAFNFQQMAQSGGDLVKQFNETAQKLEDSIDRINKSLLSDETLTDIRATFQNFRLVSERAVRTLRGVDELVNTNSHPLSIAVSNLVVFSEQLNGLGTQFQEVVATNRVEITAAIKNIESATIKVDKLLADIQEGKGLAGSLLNNKDVETNFRETLSNLSLLSSNLNKHGILWKPKAARAHPLPDKIYPGKSPF